MQATRQPMVRSENDRFWAKYCGFFDLSLAEFMAIQEALLWQQLPMAAGSVLGKRLIGSRMPGTMEEFRRFVPLTTYNDYLPDLEEGNEHSLPEKPYVWAHTSGDSASFMQVPYTLQFYNRNLDNLMAAFIVACSKRKGQSSIAEGDQVLFNVAPSPYLSGILASGANERFNLKPVIPPDAHDSMDFKEKITKGFETSLTSGVDILIAMTSVLVKMGNDFNNHSKNGKLSKHILNPNAAYRLANGWLRSKLEGRNMLPKDLWPVKAIIGWGIDTSVYREMVRQYWGIYPYELHACTEAGIVAMQSWNKKDLTFIPYSNFYEFIPESEWLASKSDIFYQPRTVLLSEVEAGERYEMVITGLYGMPFVRYRLGHLVRITALADEEAQVNLPQMVFEARADDLIDIAGFTRISEKTMAKAIASAGFSGTEWTIRKEIKEGKPALHLYIELNGDHTSKDVAIALHQDLKKVDQFYSNLDSMMDINPLKVTLLRPGTFADYYQEKTRAGAELIKRIPPRMNAPDSIIQEVIRLGRKEERKN